jgi:hypothetical protein
VTDISVYRRSGNLSGRCLFFAEADDFPLISEIYIDRAPGYARLAGDPPKKTRAEYEARSLFVEGDDP